MSRRTRVRGGAALDDSFLEQLGTRVENRMKELGLDVAAVVESTGMGSSTIYNILRAQQKNPQLTVLNAIAAALKVPLAWLVGGSSRYLREEAEAFGPTVMVMGAADAGAYRINAMNGSTKRVRDMRPTDESLCHADRYAIEIHDHHLEGLNPPVTKGHLAFYIDFAGLDAEIESDRVYLLHRQNDAGLIQIAFWRAKVTRRGITFSPVSLDRDYNLREAFTLTRDDLAKSGKVTVAGLFYRATAEYL